MADSSLFRRYARGTLGPAMNQYFGSPATIKPVLRRPNFSGTRDPARPDWSICGRFEWEHLDVKQGDIVISSREPCVTFNVNELPYDLKLGDIVVREDTGDSFEIKSLAPDGVFSIKVGLLQLGRQDIRK